MRKTLLLAACVMASVAVSTASAKDKKPKKILPATEKKVALKTPSDSLSYAAGAAITGGLKQYLAQHYKISDAQMPTFLRGLKEGFAHRSDSTFSAYAAGLAIADQVVKQMMPNVKSQFQGTKEEVNEDLLLNGFVDALRNDTTYFSQAKAQQYFEGEVTAAKEQKNQTNKAEGEKFMAENAKKAGVITTADGLQYKVLTKGSGAIPTKDDKVEVVYEGRTLDGKVFDATHRHGTESDTFGVGNLIKGWTEALTMMPVGSKWEIYIPQELAYGSRGAGDAIAPYSALIFTLELKNIVKAQPTQKVGTPAESTSAKSAGKTPVKKTAKNGKK